MSRSFETIGDRLRFAIERSKIPITKISKISGVSRQHIYNLLNNKSITTDPNLLVMLAQSLDVNPSWLYQGIGPQKFGRASDDSIFLTYHPVTILEKNRMQDNVMGMVPDINQFLDLGIESLQCFYTRRYCNFAADNTLFLVDPDARGQGTYLMSYEDTEPGFACYYYLVMRYETALGFELVGIGREIKDSDDLIGKVIGMFPWKQEYLKVDTENTLMPYITF